MTMIEMEIPSTGLDFHVDITEQVTDVLKGRMGSGLASIFAHGSTVGLTIMRYEPGAVADLLEALKTIAPADRPYLHGLTTGDPNGFSHVKSTVIGTSTMVPWRDGELAMSATHRVVLFDFDLKSSTRRVFISPNGSEQQ